MVGPRVTTIALLAAWLGVPPPGRAQTPSVSQSRVVANATAATVVDRAALPLAPPPPPDVGAIPRDAETTASGVAWKILEPGTGTVRPAATDRVTANYNGWTSTGRIFDSTDMRGKPHTFVVGNVLPGMSEAIQMMTVGEKRRVWIPENLAFRGMPGRPQGMCVMEIELLDIEAGAPAIRTDAPPDVAGPPEDCQKTKSGLASKVLGAGTGTRHPTSGSTVVVHYSGWTTDGKLFDSSALRGEPATLPLNAVIAGWSEGLQLMVEGEKRRFWIPGTLAYDNSGRQDVPKGMLVFDVELIKIQ